MSKTQIDRCELCWYSKSSVKKMVMNFVGQVFKFMTIREFH